MEPIDYTHILGTISEQLETVSQRVYSLEVAQVTTNDMMFFGIQVIVSLFLILVVLIMFKE